MERLFIISVGISLCVTLVAGSAEIKCNRRHEVQRCVNGCPPERTCKNKDIKFRCLNDNKKCENKCVCEDGFYRNPLGDCISRENCERCPGEHEYYSCGGFCDNVCSDLHEQNKTHCPVVNIVCNRKCYCEDGYARDERGKCIPIAECSDHRVTRSSVQCDLNEEYQACKTTCPPDTCESINSFYDCSHEPPCKAGCVCKEGFLRTNPTSPCMPSRKCPQLSGLWEEDSKYK